MVHVCNNKDCIGQGVFDIDETGDNCPICDKRLILICDYCEKPITNFRLDRNDKDVCLSCGFIKNEKE